MTNVQWRLSDDQFRHLTRLSELLSCKPPNRMARAICCAAQTGFHYSHVPLLQCLADSEGAKGMWDACVYARAAIIKRLDGRRDLDSLTRREMMDHLHAVVEARRESMCDILD